MFIVTLRNKLILLICLSLLITHAPVLADSLKDAKFAIRARDYDRAAQLLQSLANRGNEEALFQLAGMYRTGRGVKQDDNQAYILMKKAMLKHSLVLLAYIQTGWEQHRIVQRPGTGISRLPVRITHRPSTVLSR